MKYIYLCLLGMFSIVNSIQAQDTWVQKDSVNGPPKSAVSSFVLDGEGFVVGGLDIVDFNRKMYSYDVDQDDWDGETSIGGLNGSGLNRGGAIAFATEDKGYVGLGQGNTAPFYSDLWEYDPETTVWTQKADFIGSARRHAVSFSIDNIAYVGTGQDQDGFTNDFYKYEATTNTWTQLSDFGGAARKSAVGFTMGGQGYVGTGDDGIYVNDFWQYEPTTDVWIEKASYPGTARTGACGWGIFPTAFIACGYDNTFNYKKDVWEYNYFADVWTQRSNFIGSKRTNATAFVIDGIAYLGMGYNGVFLDDFYAYTPILSTDTYGSVITTKIYPNPTSDYLSLEFGKQIPTDLEIVIYDVLGKKVISSKPMNTGVVIQVDVKSLAIGNYVINILSKNSDFNYTSKFVVKK